jgi:hypothetical protein
MREIKGEEVLQELGRLGTARHKMVRKMRFSGKGPRLPSGTYCGLLHRQDEAGIGRGERRFQFAQDECLGTS